MYQIKQAAQAETEIRKSRFIAMALPVSERAQALRELARIRSEHPSARHVCWVLLCVGDSGMDDDGEPSGTAARPIYNVLMHRQLQNVLLVVVRYFGGIKLGAGGLMRAYSQAAVAALDAAEKTPVVALASWWLACGFAHENSLRHWCLQHDLAIAEARYDEQVRLQVSLPLVQADTLRQSLLDNLGGVVVMHDGAVGDG
ncbi:YigZ family protein [Craterilacuibacter sp. RT1T]|uniref:IMPACT family protein n=1 Tax=Craterilacuibacter sp. RT1T TaxID=2942211 RepID=UPI0020BF4D3B|nr:YigZ family protein [Craterilacuibacter sp. RT1T]MCL6262857.1 IMPACT family protein [Craterilacuibacter sp. RT1T]